MCIICCWISTPPTLHHKFNADMCERETNDRVFTPSLFLNNVMRLSCAWTYHHHHHHHLFFF